MDRDIKSYIQRLIFEEFQYLFELGKIVFVDHHLSHAVSAYSLSGFNSSLVLTIDGTGEGISGTVWSGNANRLELLQSYSDSNSLGFYYKEVIRFLGYEMFDEYKVMGLAPYGDPRRYRRFFKKFYTLLPEGQYEIHFENIYYLSNILSPRKKSEPFAQVHKDVAASLQESLEVIVSHILNYFKQKSGHQKLCLAGGVAQNCTLNGKILYSNLFEELFVQPAAHDAGCALGAALYIHDSVVPQEKTNKLEHLYWGSDIGEPEAIEKTLKEWSSWLEFKKEDHIEKKTATLLSEGKVIGWVQGRSEFGPRALGNRSILADPRPPENREVINAMVKLREGYRPFAPSVLEEYAPQFYEIPPGQNMFPHMIIVLRVKEEKRTLLGAVTHVDGSARVQTVNRHTNPKYWGLIHAFKELTDTPILLNTSFNNNVEPIVDSVYDAIICFLTTKIHFLVIGDFLISKIEADAKRFLPMRISLSPYATITQSKRHVSEKSESIFHEIGVVYSDKYTIPLSSELYRILLLSDGKRTLHSCLQEISPCDVTNEELVEEIQELWSRRLIVLYPA
ncbi:carbamoyltransferase family protein [Cohnella faecalis]|uniref:Nodulation protein n=2 Tax=Cohnella faecalis TaxID=2315694 RepID=A0A398CNM3_9BACL|nr:carbamoyltransferase C-terminal domain-containing protein [Cohnella faecalis]RIE04966.1 nodulation protein [Cohnella faecalis]